MRFKDARKGMSIAALSQAEELSDLRDGIEGLAHSAFWLLLASPFFTAFPGQILLNF
jgi:hypothetical protein